MVAHWPSMYRRQWMTCCSRRLGFVQPLQTHQQRRLTTAARAAAPRPLHRSLTTDAALNLPTHSTPNAVLEDRTIRKIFDNPSFWLSFSKTNASSPTGLFHNSDLRSPAGFDTYASRTLAKAQKVVAKICAAESEEELFMVVRDLDYLSDLLCRVIDMCDFVRSTHPVLQIVEAANAAYGTMYEYMNILNTTTGLYTSLRQALETPSVVSRWTEEEKTVARILYKDFEKSGINLPDDARASFVELSNEIAMFGHEFVNGMRPKTPALVFESSRLKGMDPMVVRELTRRGKVTLPTYGMAANHALRTVEDEGVRKELYLATRTSADDQIKTLEEMLRRRAMLAKLVGCDSYAQVTLTDKMSSSPEAVAEFLGALSTANAPAATKELQILASLKAHLGSKTPLQPWDRDYYSTRVTSAVRSRSKSSADVLSSYFSLGTVMQGLSRLFSRLYGIRFVPTPPVPGETWNPDVRRLDVICETAGHIAVVYCDLFAREGKAPNPAHFTLRCSRRISPAEEAEAAAAGEQADDGMASARHSDTGELYQLPTIALICDFEPSSGANGKTLLSFRDVQTLFHEMGHAVHSMLGRTALHNVAGTRCATDWAELPSVLMEHFATSPEVLALFARHHETDDPLPPALLADRAKAEGMFEASETRAQIVLAVLDQAYHAPLGADFDSTRAYRDVEKQHGLLAGEGEGTSWQGFFGHLFGYGATYYAYLFDRAIAAKVWAEVFKNAPLSRDAGEKYRSEVLEWGGARSGWTCLARVMGRPELEDGGRDAMREVGKWGSELK